MSENVRRRQRGLARIEQLLDAAAVVFARRGYDGATTNAIAAEAGVSPGSLYQFFRDKADLAAALGQRYAEALDRAHAEALASFEATKAPLPEVVAQILDPMIAFKEAHGAYAALFTRAALPESLAEPVARSEAGFNERIVALLRARNPKLAREDARRITRTIFALTSGVMPTLSGDSELAVELKRAILGYLREQRIR